MGDALRAENRRYLETSTCGWSTCGWRTWRICGEHPHSPRWLRGSCRPSSRRAWPRRRRSRAWCGSASLCRGCLCSRAWAAARTATSRSLSTARFSASRTAAPSRLRLGPPGGRLGFSPSCSRRLTRLAKISPPNNRIPRQGQAHRWSSRSHPHHRHRPRLMTTVLASSRAPISPRQHRLRLRFPRRRHRASQIRSRRRLHLPRFRLIHLRPRIPMPHRWPGIPRRATEALRTRRRRPTRAALPGTETETETETATPAGTTRTEAATIPTPVAPTQAATATATETTTPAGTTPTQAATIPAPVAPTQAATATATETATPAGTTPTREQPERRRQQSQRRWRQRRRQRQRERQHRREQPQRRRQQPERGWRECRG